MGYVNVPFILSIFKKHKDVEPSDERKEELKVRIEKERKVRETRCVERSNRKISRNCQ